MTTINQEIKLSGVCLMDGKEVDVTISPSDKGKIVFYPNNSDIEVTASIENVVSTLHCTVLGACGQQLRVVEHFLAACAFAGIDSLDVRVSGSELPIFDGSSKVWYDEFQKAGLTVTKNDSVNFEEPYFLTEGNHGVILLPSDHFKITYMVNFDHPELSNRWVTQDFRNDYSTIIEARTFGYLKDLEKFQSSGFALGASIDNTIGLTDTGYTVELRSNFEPIKHKILDLVGDLTLLGVNPLNFNAHIIAKEAGHRAHVEFARIIENFIER